MFRRSIVQWLTEIRAWIPYCGSRLPWKSHLDNIIDAGIKVYIYMRRPPAATRMLNLEIWSLYCMTSSFNRYPAHDSLFLCRQGHQTFSEVTTGQLPSFYFLFLLTILASNINNFAIYIGIGTYPDPDLRARAVNYFPAYSKTHKWALFTIVDNIQRTSSAVENSTASPSPMQIDIYVQIRGHISAHMHIQMVWLESYTLTMGDKTMPASN